MASLKITALLALTVLSVALCMAEPRVQAGQRPFVFLSLPRVESRSSNSDLHAIAALSDNDNDNDDLLALHSDDADDEQALDDDDDDSNAGFIINLPQAHSMAKSNSNNADEAEAEEETDVNDDDVEDANESANVVPALVLAGNSRLESKKAQSTNMLVPRDNAGAIMVPDGIIEIEGQSVYDAKTGKTALLVPRSVLDSIPDGSVVALLERSQLGSDAEDAADALEEERANRVIVRRRMKGGRRNVRRGRPVRRRVVASANRPLRRRRPVNGQRRPGKRTVVRRVIRRGNGNRRRGQQNRRRRVVLQG